MRLSTAVCLGLLAGSPAAADTLQERMGHPASARLLVIHADDLGMSHSVNRATFEALERGWITSASILVPCPWIAEAARFAQAHPEADLGIHLALNSEWTTYRWGPVSPSDAVSSLLDEQGYFPLVEPTVVEKAKLPEVEREVRAQIERARSLGIGITHLDPHMGTLVRSEGLLEIYRRMGREYGLPVLLTRDGQGAMGFTHAEGEVVLDSLLGIEPGVPPSKWLDAYKGLLAPLGPGVHQLIVHLAYDDEEMRGATADHPDWGAAWRQADLELVRSPEFQAFLREQGFVLTNWKEIAAASRLQSRTR